MSIEEPVVWVDIDSLQPHPRNTNQHTKDQIKRLAKLIEFYGWRHPILVSKQSGYIVAGHARLEAAKKLALAEVPVQIHSFPSDTQEIAFLTADNAIAEWAELDFQKILEEVGNLGPDFDVELMGLKNLKIDASEKKKRECPECGHQW